MLVFVLNCFDQYFSIMANHTAIIGREIFKRLTVIGVPLKSRVHDQQQGAGKPKIYSSRLDYVSPLAITGISCGL